MNMLLNFFCFDLEHSHSPDGLASICSDRSLIEIFLIVIVDRLPLYMCLADCVQCLNVKNMLLHACVSVCDGTGDVFIDCEKLVNSHGYIYNGKPALGNARLS